MSTLNLNNADKLYYGNTEAQKLYRGTDLLFPNTALNDPYYNDVVLYIRGDSFIDRSKYTHPLSVAGNYSISTTISKYGGKSIHSADNTQKSITANNSRLVLGNDPWTVEFWEYRLSNSGDFIFFGTTGVTITPISINISNSGWVTRSGLVGNNTWGHYAFVREANSLRCYVNGILRQTINFSSINFTSSSISILHLNIYREWRGYISSYRLTKGVARYTTNFNAETDTYLAY